MVARTDKNLGPLVMDRALSITRCLEDHLLNAQTYRILSQAEEDKKFNSFTKILMTSLHFALVILPRKRFSTSQILLMLPIDMLTSTAPSRYTRVQQTLARLLLYPGAYLTDSANG
jgi:hypothetical protein